MEINQYINNVVLPSFSGFMDSEIDTALFNQEGIIIGCTPIGAANLGLKIEDVMGMSYKTLDTKFIKKICKLTDKYNAEDILSLFKTLGKIHDIVVKHKTIINYIDIIPYSGYYSATLVTQIPIFYPENGTVIATQSFGSKHHLYGMIDYINKLNEEYNDELPTLTIPENSLNLTSRQHEVLFLLLAGLSQSEVATVLGVSRGTVSTIVAYQLNHKFGILHGTTNDLLEKARQYNLHKYIPQSLYKPKVIILDNDIQQKYFNEGC